MGPVLDWILRLFSQEAKTTNISTDYHSVPLGLLLLLSLSRGAYLLYHVSFDEVRAAYSISYKNSGVPRKSLRYLTVSSSFMKMNKCPNANPSKKTRRLCPIRTLKPMKISGK